MGEVAGGQLEPLRVEMYLDTDKVEKALKDVDKKVEKFDKKIQTLGRSFVKFGAVAGAAIGALGSKFIMAARAAEDAQRKFEAVFRSEAEGTREWLKKLAQDFALNQTQLEGWLARAQDLFVPMGMARDAAAELSQKVVEMSTKVAVFNGMPTNQVLDAMIQGMIGVTRSVRRYGIMITEARTQQKGFELGLVDANGNMTEQSKVLARLELMLSDSGDAMARAKDLMGGMRGDTQRLSTAISETSEAIGKALAPALKTFTDAVVPAIRNVQQWVKDNGAVISSATISMAKIAAYSAAFGGAAIVVGKMTVALKALAAAKIASVGGIAGVAGTGFAAYEIGRSIRRKEITEMENEARASIEQTTKDLEKLSEKQVKTWRASAKKMRGITTDELLRSIEDVISGTGPKAEIFAETFAEEIKNTLETSDDLRAAMNSFQGRFSQMMRPAEFGGAGADAPIREIVATMKARYLELVKWEEEQRAASEQRKGELRVTRFEEALDTIHEKITEGLNREMRVVTAAIEGISKKRVDALAKILAIQENMIRRAANTEQAIWEIERGDPSLSEQERWNKTYERVKEIITEARELAAEGNEELAKERLEQAAGLASQLATGDEQSYKIRASLAKNFLNEIQEELDTFAEQEIKKQGEIIEAANVALESLAETQKEMATVFEELGDELTDLAKEAGDIKIEFDATGAFLTIRKLKAELQGLTGGLADTEPGEGAEPNTGEGDEGFATIEDMMNLVTDGGLG